MKWNFVRAILGAAVWGIIPGTCPTASAAFLNIPDASFESPVVPPDVVAAGFALPFEAPGAYAYYGVTPSPWQSEGPSGNTPLGPAKFNTGIFANLATGQPGHITNADGTQLAFLSVHTVDPNNVIWQTLSDVYQAGQAYTLTVGVSVSYYQPPAADDAILLGLYYLDTLGQRQPVRTQSISLVGLRSDLLQDVSLTLPQAAVGDSWVGRPISLDIRSAGTSATGGFVDLDNVRLDATSVPEPATGLGLAGAALWLMLSRRGRNQILPRPRAWRLSAK